MTCKYHLPPQTKKVLLTSTTPVRCDFINFRGVVNTFPSNDGMYLINLTGSNNSICVLDPKTFQLYMHSYFSDDSTHNPNYSSNLGAVIYPIGDGKLRAIYSYENDRLTIRDVTDIREDDGSSSDDKQDIKFNVPKGIIHKQEQKLAKHLRRIRATPDHKKVVLCMEGGAINIYDPEKQELKTLVIPCDRDNGEYVLTQDVFVLDNDTAWVTGSITHDDDEKNKPFLMRLDLRTNKFSRVEINENGDDEDEIVTVMTASNKGDIIMGAYSDRYKTSDLIILDKKGVLTRIPENQGEITSIMTTPNGDIVYVGHNGISFLNKEYMREKYLQYYGADEIFYVDDKKICFVNPYGGELVKVHY